MTAADERRLRVLAAVVAIGARPHVRGVAPFHVKHFGIPECVTEPTLATITSDLRELLRRGRVEQVEGSRPAKYIATEAGASLVKSRVGS